jgi:hypothetical protein
LVITLTGVRIHTIKAVIRCFWSDKSIPMYLDVKGNSSVRLNLPTNSLNKISGFIYCLTRGTKDMDMDYFIMTPFNGSVFNESKIDIIIGLSSY